MATSKLYNKRKLMIVKKRKTRNYHNGVKQTLVSRS